MKYLDSKALLCIFIAIFLSISSASAQTVDLSGYIKARDSIIQSKIGMPFVEFELFELNGEKISEKCLTGKVALIIFWFQSCAPCIAELDDLTGLYEDFKDNSEFQLLSIARDSPDVVKNSIERFSIPYTVYIMGNNEYGELVQGYPTTIIVDKKSKIRFIKVRGSLNKEKIAIRIEEYKQEIQQLLNE